MRAAVIFCCALALCTYAAAQSPGAGPSAAAPQIPREPNAWAAVQGLSAGSPVAVRLADGAKLKGKLVAVSASGMDLRTRHTIRYISRAQIRTLSLTGTSHVLPGAWAGFGIGAVTGAVLGASYGSGDCGPPPAPGFFYGYQPCERVAVAAVGGALLGAVGAAAGGLLGLIKSGRQLVYQSGPDRNLRGQKSGALQKPAAALPAAAAGSARD